MNFSAVILAGGKSSRMGRDKAFLETGGQTLLARQIQLGAQIGAAEILISGRSEADYSTFGCQVLQDQFANAGPLAGVERALASAKSPMLLVLAVDLPDMNAVFLRRLAADCTETCGAIPRLDGQIEPLAAFYPTTTHPVAVANLERGILAVKDFARRCVNCGLARFTDFAAQEARCLSNWNSPTHGVGCGFRL
jgi:molybdopterin-guanine dinucleotide biosynthesis protein A